MEASMDTQPETITPTEEPKKKKKKKKKKLQPRRKTLEQIGICARTAERWEKDPTVGFPQPTIIRNRKYDDPDQIAAFMQG
jgi:hypothetical protein